VNGHDKAEYQRIGVEECFCSSMNIIVDQSLNIVNKTPNASAAASASLKLTVWPGVKQLMRPQASV
jgi:hypothetical protein